MGSTMTTQSVDVYLRDGCGRCARFRTPSCSVHRWGEALARLRALVRETALTETVKWGSPCYTLGGKNVVTLGAFIDDCVLSFFKGAALEDPDGILEPPGPNSRFARVLRFRSVEEVEARRDVVVRLLAEAIELERSGRRVAVAPAEDPMPDELLAVLTAQPDVRAAFDALTPGRRRSHILHVAGATQATTRSRRAESCVPIILAGRGRQER